MASTVICIKENSNFQKEKLSEFLSDYEFIEENNIFVIHKDVLEKAKETFKKAIAMDKLFVFNISEIDSLINKKEIKHIELEQIDCNYDFIKNNYFIVSYNNKVELNQIEKRTVTNVFDLNNINSAFQSHCGLYFGFIKNKSVKIYAGEEFYLFFSVDYKNRVIRCSFSKDDKFLLIETSEEFYVYDFLTGKRIVIVDNENIEECTFYLHDNNLYNNENTILVEEEKDKSLNSDLNIRSTKDNKNLTWFLNCKKKDSGNEFINLQTGKVDNTLFKINEEINDHKVFTVNNIFVEIYKFKTQMVLKTNFTSKTYLNVADIKVYCANEKIFVLLTKAIGENLTYSMEVFDGEKIAFVSFKNQVDDIVAIDGACAVIYAAGEIEVYKKHEFMYKKMMSIQKYGGSLVEMKFIEKKLFTVIYDSREEKLEMYENEKRASTFSHKKCTGIKWSDYGLYVAAFSEEASAGGMVQIINTDGKLMFKQIYTRLNSFEWRNSPKITKEKVKEIMKNYSEPEDEEESSDIQEIDVKKFATEWIEYLRSIKC